MLQKSEDALFQLFKGFVAVLRAANEDGFSAQLSTTVDASNNYNTRHQLSDDNRIIPASQIMSQPDYDNDGPVGTRYSSYNPAWSSTLRNSDDRKCPACGADVGLGLNYCPDYIGGPYCYRCGYYEPKTKKKRGEKIQ